MQSGTSRVSSTTLSAMAKRAREGRGQLLVGQGDCPICFDSMGARTETRPFQCEHPICRTCDRSMARGDDHRCPTCRAPRRGLTAEQAEPPPGRNQAEPSIEDFLPPEVAGALGDLQDQVAQMATVFMGARGYGLPPGSRPLNLERRPTGPVALTHRENTGHAMFFPMEPATFLQPTPGADPMPEDLVLGGLHGAEAHTLLAMGAIPAEAIYALLNVPDVSLHQWQAMRAQRARPPPPPSRAQPAPPARRQRPRTSRAVPDSPFPASRR